MIIHTISGRLRAYAALTKPRLSSLVLFSTMAGYYLGLEHWKSGLHCFYTLLGSALAAGGSMALNQWMEKSRDAKMRRTLSRPLPTGQLQSRDALLFGVFLCASGLALLLSVNRLSSFISLATILIYLLLYTPAKPLSSLSTIIGAVPGALPPLIGWAAASENLNAEAWALFAIIFCWQIPHFYAISWLYREDFAAGGFRMLAVIDKDGKRLSKQIVLFTMALIPISLLPFFLGTTGFFYLGGALILDALFLHAAFLAKRDINKNARYLFRASLFYLSLLLLFMILNKTQ
jgi:heme o synthase